MILRFKYKSQCFPHRGLKCDHHFTVWMAGPGDTITKIMLEVSQLHKLADLEWQQRISGDSRNLVCMETPRPRIYERNAKRRWSKSRRRGTQTGNETYHLCKSR